MMEVKDWKAEAISVEYRLSKQRKHFLTLLRAILIHYGGEKRVIRLPNSALAEAEYERRVIVESYDPAANARIVAMGEGE